MEDEDEKRPNHPEPDEKKPPARAQTESTDMKVKVVQRPSRPLNAYNLFFKSERNRMVEALPPSNKPRTKLGFGGMARIVSQRWKAISEEEKAHYVRLAEQDKQRYYREMDTWYRLNNQDDDDEDGGEEDSRNIAKESEPEFDQMPPPDASSGSQQQATAPTVAAPAAASLSTMPQQQLQPQLPPAATSWPGDDLLGQGLPLFPYDTAPYEPQPHVDDFSFNVMEPPPAPWPTTTQRNPIAEMPNMFDSPAPNLLTGPAGLLPASIQPIGMPEGQVVAPQGSTDRGDDPPHASPLHHIHHGMQRFEESKMRTTPPPQPPSPLAETQDPPARQESSSEEDARFRLLASRLGDEAVDFVVDIFQKKNEEQQGGSS